MIKRLLIGAAVAAGSLGAMAGVAGATQGPDSKKAFPVFCQTGSLAGETLTVVSGKTAYLDDGTQLRLTALRFEFGDKVKDKQFGKTQGTLTCGGSETSPEGTFTFFATLVEV